MKLLLAILLSAPVLSAQTYVAQRIQFSNLGSFTQQQLEDATQVHPGTSLTATDLAAAATRLVDTGYFDDVSATVDGRISAVTVKFDVKPTPLAAMLPVAFENFVWLTPAEIDAAIHTTFPLFNHYLPEASPKEEVIKAALTQALAAKSITATVAFDTFEPTLRQPVRQIFFRIDKPAIRVANVHLTGVSPALVPYVQKSVNATAHTSYTAGPANFTTAQLVLAPLLDAGYAQAALEDVTVTPSSQTAEGPIGVVINATLNAGELYHLSALNFAGTPLLSAADFAASAKLHPGDLASRAALIDSLKPIDTAYRNQGYLDVVVDATPAIDSAAHTIAYTVAVTPGDQYRLHQVTTSGLDAAGKAEFDRTFSIKPDQLYSPAAVAGYLVGETTTGPLHGYAAAFKAYADPATHTVDLVVTFYKAGS